MQQSKDDAEEALKKIPEIEARIEEAEDKTREAQDNLAGAEQDAKMARDIATDAEDIAKMASDVNKWLCTGFILINKGLSWSIYNSGPNLHHVIVQRVLATQTQFNIFELPSRFKQKCKILVTGRICHLELLLLINNSSLPLNIFHHDRMLQTSVVKPQIRSRKLNI